MFEAPSIEQCFLNFIALNPRGRAWQTQELIGEPGTQSVYRRFWHALAMTWHDLEQAVVDMMLEAFCDTAVTDLDLWIDDYSDECGLAAVDLCLKVKPVKPGHELTYYTEVATALGYSADFNWLKGEDTGYPGVVSTLLVIVSAGGSGEGFGSVPVGEFVLGVDRLGGSGTDILECILNSIVPAHINVIFVVTT